MKWVLVLSFLAGCSSEAFAGSYSTVVVEQAVSGTGDSTKYLRGDGTWSVPPSGAGGSIPAGLIVLTLDAACPAGFTEATALSGKFVLGTLSASVNVGTTGGADTVTSSGTVSQPVFTGNAFSSVINHTHAVAITDPGHNHTQNAHAHMIPVGATDDTAAPFDRADAGTNASGANATTASGSTTATNISSVTGITASSSNPAGGVSSITPSGTVSQPSFTGVSFDNRPAFIRVIFCQKD